MSRWHSYLHSTVQILQSYKGEEPLAPFLKKFFSTNKKYGSTDRKQIAHLCYCYFRLGKSTQELPVEERVLTAVFLCSGEKQTILQELRPEWNNTVELPVEEKCALLDAKCSITDVFPWEKELSEGVEHEKFCASFFIQPDLFLRLRPGKEDIVQKKLQQAGITFHSAGDHCIALVNSSKIDEVIMLNKEAVVQDYNSQRTAELMRVAIESGNKQVWDCCAASGGKSIMAYDIDLSISLTVSDVRESILANLKKRFAEAGIQRYKALMLDLTRSNVQQTTAGVQYSLIIADVPCSGSGTWSRTPERLYYFTERKIEEYSSLQKKITANAISQLQPGGYFLYITCSVFAKENEENVAYMQQHLGLELIKMELLKGYDKRADTLFAALLRK